MKTIKLLACACAVFASSVAMAEVTFDPATGTGFVGKGDVQSVFGWNNAMLQANAGALTFTYVALDSYTAVCTFTTGTGTRGQRTHNVTHRTSTGVSNLIDSSPRTRMQVTGFRLNGIASSSVTQGAVPVVGGACPGNQGHDGVWTSATMTSSTAALTVNLGTTSHQIWPAAL